ncbi:MAG: HAMP domain-containing protein [Chloroflexaceae bacterium]|nr:HAMP domain-containing protein [Chloroflexaceae bacterium]
MSLRTRLVIYYTGFFGFALLLLSLGIFMTVKQVLEQGVERDLRAGTKQVLEIYRQRPVTSSLDIVVRDGAFTPQVRGQPAATFAIPNLLAQVFAPDGKFLGSSMNLADAMVPLPTEALDLQAGAELMMTETINNTHVRSLITPLALSNGRIVGYLQISRPLSDVEDTLQLLLTILVGGGFIALFVTAVGVAALSGTALAPIDQVVRTAQGIVNAEDLGRRVPVPTTQDEVHRLTVTINGLLERLEKLFTAQRRLIADVSHELRTPLAAMHGNLEVLSRGAHRDPELLHESLTDMRQETTRLIRMVNDLLLLAQADAGIELRKAPVELDTLLLEVHRELRTLSGGVNLRIGAEDQVVVQGDRDRIKQALLNLGVNALQHTPTGGTVTLSLERCDGFACLAVADTGTGIALEELEHIFERFYRTDRSRSRLGGGAGLGLAIVKRIIDGHGGNVTVESVLDYGSTFTIRLPLEKADEEVVLPATEPQEAGQLAVNRG